MDLEKINLIYKNTIETQGSTIEHLSECLALAQREVDELKKG
jgi:hypothetical protein